MLAPCIPPRGPYYENTPRGPEPASGEGRTPSARAKHGRSFLYIGSRGKGRLMQVLQPNRESRYAVRDLRRFPRTRQNLGFVRLAVLSPRPLGSQPPPATDGITPPIGAGTLCAGLGLNTRAIGNAARRAQAPAIAASCAETRPLTMHCTHVWTRRPCLDGRPGTRRPGLNGHPEVHQPTLRTTDVMSIKSSKSCVVRRGGVGQWPRHKIGHGDANLGSAEGNTTCG